MVELVAWLVGCMVNPIQYTYHIIRLRILPFGGRWWQTEDDHRIHGTFVFISTDTQQKHMGRRAMHSYLMSILIKNKPLAMLSATITQITRRRQQSLSKLKFVFRGRSKFNVSFFHCFILSMVLCCCRQCPLKRNFPMFALTATIWALVGNGIFSGLVNENVLFVRLLHPNDWVGFF